MIEERICIDCGAPRKSRGSIRCRSCASRRFWQTGILRSRNAHELLETIVRRTRKSATGCLEWTGMTNSKGYGRISINGTLTLVHRFVFQNQIGPIPEGYEVCHSCDNPLCLNVDHLFLGTHSDNMRDMIRKGRQCRQKLSNSDVIAIRSMTGMTQRELAALFGVARSTIACIRCGVNRPELY